MKDKLSRIRDEYNSFYDSLLKQGKLPVRSTALGLWSATPADLAFSLFKIIGLKDYMNFIDLGSGDGSVVLTASLFTKAVGIEHDPDLFEKSAEIKEKLCLENSSFIQGDFMEHDIRDYDVVFMNPDKSFHRGAEQKLLKELNGILLVYNDVFMPGLLKKERTLRLGQVPVGVYRKL